jgi:sugar lactone lactonase YvrE
LKYLLLFLGLSALIYAGSTRTWVQSEVSDFEKGQLHGLSMRSDGRISVAPKVTELFDPSSAYLWALGRDSKGNLYAGGGPGAKLFMISPDGSHKTLAQFDALEIHAIAVDSHDQIFVGTSPDGKIYRVAANGKSEQFYDPKQKYIWGMVFGPQGDLFVATGDKGEVHRVDRNGKGSMFFKTEETHARSIAVDDKGNLVIGTDPGGLVIRVSTDGAGFVLYQMAKREVTAVAAGPDGAVYAAGVSGTASAPAIPPPPQQMTISISPSGAAPVLPGPAATTPMSRTANAGSADLVRIGSDGTPERLWTSGRETIYAIAFDEKGRPLLGGGSKGTLYRIDSAVLSTALLNVSSTQITALLPGAGGALFAAASNVGKVFRFGPELETEGALESDVFDAGNYSQWGRLKTEGQGKISLLSRSGNLDRPQQNWSAWAPVKERITSPPARFLQWKAVLAAGAEMDSVEAAYLPKNVAPKVEEIESTPPNYKFSSASSGLPGFVLPATLSLPPMGKKTSSPSMSVDLGTNSMTLAKGWIGARWTSSDENGDPLTFTIEIRGADENSWKPLAEKVREKHCSFDSTAWPDGEYRVRVTASDALGNIKDEALTGQLVSAPFLIDNTPPAISKLSGTRDGSGLHATWNAADALNVIKRAEYSIDGGDWLPVEPKTKLSDSPALQYELKLPALSSGEHLLAVRVTDDYDNTAVAKTVVR